MNGAVIVWLGAAVVLGIVEGLTVALVSVWMAVGAVCAAVVAALGGSILLQILVFLVVSALLLVVTIPLTKKFRQHKSVSTNADRLIGAEGVVIRKLDPIENKGQIKALGQIWSASSVDHSEIEIGEKVVVQAIEGVHAIVKAEEKH